MDEIISVQVVNMMTQQQIQLLRLQQKQPECSSYGYDIVQAIKAEEAKTVLAKTLDFKKAAVWRLQKFDGRVRKRKSCGFRSLSQNGTCHVS